MSLRKICENFGSSTGHWTPAGIEFKNQFDAYSLRAHAELLNYDISFFDEGNITFDESFGDMKMRNDQSELKKKFWFEIKKYPYAEKIIRNLSKNCAEIVLASMLLTDGHIYKHGRENSIAYKGYDKELHLIFAGLVNKATGSIPGTFLKLYNENGALIYRTIYNGRAFLNKLLMISPDYRTSPRNLSKVKFLRQFKPSLKFAFDENKKVKKLILQLAMSAEGYVSPAFERNFRINVGFACAHPNLVLEWKRLFSEFGVNMIMKRCSNSWAGVNGLCISDINEVKKFYTRIGFTPTIKIGNHSALKGLAKQFVLKKAIDYHDYMSYKYRIEGNPIKNYKNGWKRHFLKYMKKQTTFNETEKKEFEKIFSALGIIGKKIRPSKFIKVLNHIRINKKLDNSTFRKITGYTGIYAWSRCRRALKSYFNNEIREQKVWRSYEVKLDNAKKMNVEKPKKVLLLGSGALNV